MTTRSTRFNLRTLSLLVLASLGCAGSAQAATSWSENFGTCSSGSSIAGAGSFSTWDPCGSGTSTNVRVGAVASTGLTTSIQGSVYSYGTSGLGVVNTTESADAIGPHSVDSYSGIDALVLNFANAVSLSSFSIGWDGTDNPATNSGVSYNDSDMSVYYWSGSSAPLNFNKSTTGWQLVSNYLNVGSNTAGAGTDAQNVTTTAYSSYWLISALGGSSGSTTACSSTSADKCVDAFKLLTVAGTTYTPPGGGVPEPGSLALLGLGALGLVASRRRAARQDKA